MSISKNGNLTIGNLYEYKAMSIFCDSNGKLYEDKSSYTPTTGVNSCIGGKLIDIETNVRYSIECTLSWTGFDSMASNFDAWFQGTANESWSYGNPMTASLNNHYKPKNAILSSASGSYHYRTSFINTDSEIKNLRLGFRSDNSNGKGIVTISDVIIVPEKYYMSDKIKARFADDYVSCDEIIEL